MYNYKSCIIYAQDPQVSKVDALRAYASHTTPHNTNRPRENGWGGVHHTQTEAYPFASLQTMVLTDPKLLNDHFVYRQAVNVRHR